MGKSAITNPKDCMNPEKVEKFALQNDLTIRKCAGDHKIIEGYNPHTKERDCMVYCNRPMGFGLACKIYKFFKALGLLILICGIVFIILLNIM